MCISRRSWLPTEAWNPVDECLHDCTLLSNAKNPPKRNLIAVVEERSVSPGCDPGRLGPGSRNLRKGKGELSRSPQSITNTRHGGIGRQPRYAHEAHLHL